MDVHPIKNGIFIGIDPYPYIASSGRKFGNRGGGNSAEFSTRRSPGRAPGFPWRLPIVGGPDGLVGPVDSDLSKNPDFSAIDNSSFCRFTGFFKPFFGYSQCLHFDVFLS